MSVEHNPMVPLGVRSLLAEEWTIQPLSQYPSFLECCMIDEAESAMGTAAITGLSVIEDRLWSYVNRQREGQYNESQRVNDSDLKAMKMAQRLHIRARQIARTWSIRMSSTLHRFIKEYCDLLICLARYVAERQSLRSHSSTLCEGMYGVVREKVLENGKLAPLQPRDHTRLALILALAPYIHSRLLYFCRKAQRSLGNASEFPAPGKVSKGLHLLKRLFVKGYPLAVKALKASNVVIQWRYLLGVSHYIDLRSKLTSQIARRKTQQDSNTDIAPIAKKNISTNTIMAEQLRNSLLCMATLTVALSWLSQLRRWYQERVAQQALITVFKQDTTPTSFVLPPPPCSKRTNLPQKKGCPLCGNLPLVHPTACATSGVCYCLSCIVAFVKENGTCPVSGVTVDDSLLIRLFEPAQMQT